jgi:hypothetical protein
MRSLLYPSLLACLCGCPSSAPEDGKRTAELADKLVSCQNERSALKEQLGGAQVELQQLKAQADKAPAAAPAAPAQEQPKRAGRSLPRHGLPSHDVAAARPAVQRTGPDNPAAEAKAAQEMAQQLRSQGSQFRPCYERGLKRNANLQFVNQIKVRLTVGPDGRAREVHTIPRTESDMESCIAQLVSRWQVTPYKGQPVQVEMPVNLRVQGQ